MKLEPSEVDSSRFGLRIGRLTLAAGPSVPDDLIARFEASALDLLVLRIDAADVTGFEALVRQLGPNTRLLHADTLMFWAGATSARAVSASHPGYSVAASPPPVDAIEVAVRDIFGGYINHYAANPLTPNGLVVDGYVEWAIAHLEGDDSEVHAVMSGREVAALAAVTYRPEEVEIDLAGVAEGHRMRGLYQHLLDVVAKSARERGIATASISTQVHNVAPQRAWARRGWLPAEAFQTLHLVRAT